MKKTLLALALFSAAIGSAQAADMPVKAPVYVAPFTWTGIYLGINAGYGTGNSTGRPATARTRPGSSAAWVARTPMPAAV